MSSPDLRDQLQTTLGTAYILGHELGGGGMSRVFVADETRLGRKVVVKLLSPELAAGVSGERFEREIMTAASLQQANIVPVLASGESNGLPYYTMPFVEGQSLRARLGRGPLAIAEVVGVLKDVSKALAYAHQRGVVHRDIKPDNVLISGGTAVVTDFGIAKAISASRTQHDGATLTQLGTSLGTPAYMSPEQAAGDPDIDHRADIYAFGCMAYELLTGYPPFHGRTPQRVLAAQMAESPQPIGELRADTPPALADLVMRSLAKDAAARPESATELVRVLDTVTSGSSMSSLPPVLIGGHGMLRRALLTYAAAFVVVAVVAKASIVAVGLPDWVLPGAIVVMLLGLPVILFTGYVQRTTYHALTATPALTPGGSTRPQGTMATIAVKASPHVNWRRTTLGGVVALGAFIVMIGVFMLLRAFGIGPAGSLLAAGKLQHRQPVLITDFRVNRADTSLGSVVTEAVRATLGQSSAITLVTPATVAAALRRMERPDTSHVDMRLAGEIAAREGYKAIVDGEITGVGSGFVVALRLASTDSAADLWSDRATARNLDDLLPTVDDLTRKLRGRIGESLRDVQGAPRLAQVTTSSLDALRKFSAANRANDVEQNYPKAVALLREAVAIDPLFAEAWRKLAVALRNARLPRSQSDSAVSAAYRLRERLTESERLSTTAYYYYVGPGRDRAKAIPAYEALMERGDTGAAANNLALVYLTRREFAHAESLFAQAIRQAPGFALPYNNIASTQVYLGKLREADASALLARTRFPANPTPAQLQMWMWYYRGKFEEYGRALDSARHSANVNIRSRATFNLADLSALKGKLADYQRLQAEGNVIDSARGVPTQPVSDSIRAAFDDAWFRQLPERAVTRLDAILARRQLESLDVVDRPYFALARAYAVANRPDRARAVLAKYAAETKDTAQLRDEQSDLHAVLGEIALAEKRPRDAIAEFRKADQKPDGPAGADVLPLYFNLGRAFDAANEADSAIVMFEKYVGAPSFVRPFGFDDPIALAGISKRLGELYEAKGERAKAAEYYQKFVDLWKNADPELQPKVTEIRRRLARLQKSESGND
jgi:tetratricopeptide (TPR) repeat protein/tRNA A-37 threonylcarbamoyl transferase component Bud32/TolB-like protein